MSTAARSTLALAEKTRLLEVRKKFALILAFRCVFFFVFGVHRAQVLTTFLACFAHFWFIVCTFENVFRAGG